MKSSGGVFLLFSSSCLLFLLRKKENEPVGGLIDSRVSMASSSNARSNPTPTRPPVLCCNIAAAPLHRQENRRRESIHSCILQSFSLLCRSAGRLSAANRNPRDIHYAFSGGPAPAHLIISMEVPVFFRSYNSPRARTDYE